jgi:hypothetical protein
MFSDEQIPNDMAAAAAALGLHTLLHIHHRQLQQLLKPHQHSSQG